MSFSPDDFPVPDGYRIEPYGQPGGPAAEDIMAMWERDGVLDAETRGRRAHETILVALGPDGDVVGVGTVHLARSRQLHLAFWHPTVYVAEAHQRSTLGTALAVRGPVLLEQRYVSGEDLRAVGILAEIQHKGMREKPMNAEWQGFSFVGQTTAGFERWITYFPGAQAPEPPELSVADPVMDTSLPEVAPAPAPAVGPIVLVAAPGAGAEPLRAALTSAQGIEPVDLDPVLGQTGVADDDAAPRLRALAATSSGTRPLLHGAHVPLHVPLLASVWPEATFVFFHRDPDEAVPVALAHWEAGDAVTHAELPGWDGPSWSFALTQGWRALRDAPLTEVVAAQWEEVTRVAVADLQRLAPERWSVAHHAAMRADPGGELERLGGFLGLEGAPDPGVLQLGAPPDLNEELEVALRRTYDTAAVAATVFAIPPREERTAPPEPAGVRSVFTESLAGVLAQLRASVILTAPAAGAVITLRRAGDEVNTEVSSAVGATALAAHHGRLAIGTPLGVALYHDVPQARKRLSGTIARDACFLPHSFRHTGDIGAGEIAWAGDELWLVASRFSALVTLDDRHSFVPRWRPPSAPELGADDSTGLNGLCVVDGEVRYVTALGATDTGGSIMDVRDGGTVAGDLAAPCSPRWHAGRLWVLLSELGALAVVDPESGAVEEVARVPGVARGLAFAGSLAFVGVSAGAGGADRRAGVWVIDTASGGTVAFAEFTAGIGEVGDVQVLEGIAFPEISEPGSDAARNAFLLPED